MSELADDIESTAESITERDEYEERFHELIEKGIEQGLSPAENLNQLMDELADEFVIDNPNYTTDAGPASDLLVESFRRATADKFALHIRDKANEGDFEWAQINSARRE